MEKLSTNLKNNIGSCVSHTFDLKNVHDGYYFMCILFFPLKGLCVSLYICVCVTVSACMYNHRSTSEQNSHPSFCVCVKNCMYASVYVCVYMCLRVSMCYLGS